LSGFSASESAS